MGMNHSLNTRAYLGREKTMTKLEKLLIDIEALTPEEFASLRKWFSERDWEQWDRQIEADSQSDKLDFLVEEALNEKKQGKLKDL
jgi:hypothetical protein